MSIKFEFQGDPEYQLGNGVFNDHPDQRVRFRKKDFRVVKRCRDEDGIPVLICRDEDGEMWQICPEQCVGF